MPKLIRRSKKGVPALAQGPDLVGRIQRDIAALGLVGQEEEGLLGYVGGTSRLIARPLSLIYLGKSSSGKSSVQRIPLELFPTSVKVDVTEVTEASLYRMGEHSLSHKALVCGERKRIAGDAAAQAQVMAVLRQLISEGRVTKQLCIKDPETNEWAPRTFDLKGPVAYSETTTSDAASVFTEDLNRMVRIHTNESESQTRNVMKGMACHYAKTGPRVDREGILQRHWEFQESLVRAEVRVPYAELLAEKIPAGRVEARRVFQQVLATVEAIALLHQFQRGRDEQGFLVAAVQDYGLARRLLLRPLSYLGLGDGAKESYDKLKLVFDDGVFSTTDAERALRFSGRKVTGDSLRKLQEAGILRRIQRGKGPKPTQWQFTEVRPEDLSLPRVESLRY